MAKHKVFLSYCNEDRRDVGILRDDLIAAGFDVWWDQDIPAGADWKFEIRQAMKACTAFVICFSQNTQARSKAGIYPELDGAIELFRERAPGERFIFPVRLSQCQVPPVDLGATRTLDRIQHVDLFPPGSRQSGLTKLIDSISHP